MPRIQSLTSLAIMAALASPSAFANCTTQTFVQSTRTAPAAKRIDVADFNGDQKPDVATVTSDRGVVVFLNQSGTLNAGTNFAATKTNLIDLITGDFNADGKADLLALDSLGTTFVVLLGDGAGSFTTSEFAAPLPAGFSLARIAAGNFDSDGDSDFVAVTNGTSGIAPLFFSNGDGTFTSPGGLTLQTKVSTLLATVDFDGDGKIDIINGYSGTSLMEVRLGDGAGNFTYAGVLPSGMSPSSIAMADLNGDGKTDVVSTNLDSGTFTVTLATMAGFDHSTDYYSGHFVNNLSKPIDVAIADFNNDGNKDIIVANSQEGTITLFRGAGDGTFGTTPAYFLFPNQYASSPRSLGVTDLDGDGRSDVVTADTTSSNLTVMTNGCGISTFDVTLDHPVITTGQNAKLTIVVAAPDPQTQPAPTGTVNVRDAGGILATTTLENGYAIVTISPTTGHHDVYVEYLGDANYDAHNSPAKSLDVTNATTSVHVSVDSSVLSITVTSSTGDTPGGYIMRTTDGSQTINPDTLPFTPRDVSNLGPGTHTINVDYYGDNTHPPSTSGIYTFTIQAAAAPVMSATWDGSRVVVQFTTNGATTYEIMRATGSSSTPQYLTTVTSSPYNDNAVSANTAYRYRVDAYDGSHNLIASSNIDLTTTVAFTDATLTAHITNVKAAHFTDLRTAANLLRTMAGQSAMNFTNGTPSAGAVVRSSHATDLRTAINEARVALGAPAITWADSTLTTIKASHIQEMRDALR